MASDQCPSCGATVDAVDQLRRAVESRDVIGQAKGLVMATMNCGAVHAYALLSEESQRMHTRVRDVAASLVARHEAVSDV